MTAGDVGVDRYFEDYRMYTLYEAFHSPAICRSAGRV